MQLALNNLVKKEETSFEFGLPSTIAHFPKQHHRSSAHTTCFATKWREEREIYVPLASSARNIHA